MHIQIRVVVLAVAGCTHSLGQSSSGRSRFDRGYQWAIDSEQVMICTTENAVHNGHLPSSARGWRTRNVSPLPRLFGGAFAFRGLTPPARFVARLRRSGQTHCRQWRGF